MKRQASVWPGCESDDVQRRAVSLSALLRFRDRPMVHVGTEQRQALRKEAHHRWES